MSEHEGSTTGEELKQRLNQQIDAARGKLEALKQEMTDMHQEDVELLRQKQDEIRIRLDRQRDRARSLQVEIARWKDEKTSHTLEAIAAWRQRRELEKLQERAHRAEDFAMRMVNMAAIDFEEAEQAVLDAVAARLDVDLASSTAAASTR